MKAPYIGVLRLLKYIYCGSSNYLGSSKSTSDAALHQHWTGIITFFLEWWCSSFRGFSKRRRTESLTSWWRDPLRNKCIRAHTKHMWFFFEKIILVAAPSFCPLPLFIATTYYSGGKRPAFFTLQGRLNVLFYHKILLLSLELLI